MNLLGQHSPSPWSRRVKFRRALWVLVSATVFRWSPTRCFGWRNLILRMFGSSMETNTDAPPRIWPDVNIHFPENLSMKPGTLIGPGCRIYNLGPVSLEAGANLSRHIHVCSGSHDYSKWTMPLTVAPIVIGENAWVATDCFIGPGVSIGPRCVVGARSVVVKDLPADMLCVGHPCVPLKPRPVIS